MNRTIVGLVVTLIAALPAAGAGQASGPPSVARAISLPDTLGAGFSIADSASGKGTAADYDFLVGMWHFTFQQRARDGAFRPAFTGHWMAEKRNVAGGFLEDRWRPDNPGETWDAGTYTYRAYDPTKQQWAIQGVNTGRGLWQPGVTWSDGSARYLVQHGAGSILRIKYFDITPNRFLWRADISFDGGQQWIRDWWSMEVKRVGR